MPPKPTSRIFQKVIKSKQSEFRKSHLPGLFFFFQHSWYYVIMAMKKVRLMEVLWGASSVTEKQDPPGVVVVESTELEIGKRGRKRAEMSGACFRSPALDRPLSIACFRSPALDPVEEGAERLFSLPTTGGKGKIVQRSSTRIENIGAEGTKQKNARQEAV